MSIQVSCIDICPPKEEVFEYQKGSVCILFSHAAGFTMPVSGRVMPFPVFSNYLFFEQNESYPFTFKSSNESYCIILAIPFDMLHEVISGTSEQSFPVDAMSQHNSYHKFGANTPEISACIQALRKNWDNKLLREAKKFELLSVYFNQKSDKVYSCPFLNQKENVEKVRKAKSLLISDLQNAPTIKALSKEVAMNEHSLKSGFKEIFGMPIYSYLKSHKMTIAKGMLLEKQKSVNQIAHDVGYSNVSHFIEAFKKKYGKTPKQFSLQQ